MNLDQFLSTKTTNAKLREASITGDLEVVNFLIKSGANVNGDLNGMTALHWAGSGGNVEVVELLIKYGADLSKKTKEYGFTVIECSPHGVNRVVIKFQSELRRGIVSSRHK
eukprot:TRINITY_DN8666_c0_g1_i1.p1 TRINITY_DN8666_c0_g1~~TRINITY_DN8666_c0_g1_i1.p1  ORF type:complete len:111 (-),score=7.96 TRINITY_DN8666_c0_g1_i1:57-389(-)